MGESRDFGWFVFEKHAPKRRILLGARSDQGGIMLRQGDSDISLGSPE